MAKRSAGLLLFRLGRNGLEVLLAHPGGPFWMRRDAGAWSIPKGEYGRDEEPLAAAQREFQEETGHPAPVGSMIPLGEIVQDSGKLVTAFAVEAEFEPDSLCGDKVEIEWPPRSGRRESYPEIDKVAWFDLAEAGFKVLPTQRAFLERLAAALNRGPR